MRTRPSTENVIAAPAVCSQLDGDGLRLRVLVEGFDGLLPPVAGLLEPAEGKLHSPAGPIGVDEDLPGLDLGEIGRASCRERGEMTVLAVVLTIAVVTAAGH